MIRADILEITECFGTIHLLRYLNKDKTIDIM
jgi:hypothetical protein